MFDKEDAKALVVVYVGMVAFVSAVIGILYFLWVAGGSNY